MFEVGFSELLLIMGLALLVLGPEKLPKVVSEIGRWMGRARAMARQFREQLEDESLEFGKRRQTPPASSPSATASAATASPATGDSTTPAEPSVTDTPATGTPTLEDAVQRHAEAAVPDHVPLGGDTFDPFPETPAADAPAASTAAQNTPASTPTPADPDRPGT